LSLVFYGCEIWSTTEGRTQTEGIQEQNAEENIWTLDKKSPQQTGKHCIVRNSWFVFLTRVD